MDSLGKGYVQSSVLVAVLERMEIEHTEIPSDSGTDPPAELEEWKLQLQRRLDSITSLGNMAIANNPNSIFPNPGLSINGKGLVSLPLVDRDALTIKEVCRQASFGRGDETVVDTSVRKTWELDHSQFKLTNTEWPEYFKSMSAKLADSLGLKGVVVRPYKLLLYKEG